MTNKRVSKTVAFPLRSKAAVTVAAAAAAAALATVATVGASASSAAANSASATKPPKHASVSGTAQVHLTFHPDEDIRSFSFDVDAAPYSRPLPGAPNGLPTDARGTVRISHHVAGQDVTVRSQSEVDCLVTAPGVATLTAVVTEADPPIEDWVGKRLGLSVYDARGRHRDRVGFSWAVVNGDQNDEGEWEEGRAGTCMAPAPFAPASRGNLKVRHADLLPEPSGG